MSSKVVVNQRFEAADFKEGDFIKDREFTDSKVEDVYYVEKVRQDGILDCRLAVPPYTSRNPRASDMAPFYGTIIVESKP